MNIKLKRRNTYLKRLAHNNKQQRKKGISIELNTTDTKKSAAAVRENFDKMIVMGSVIESIYIY